MKRKIAAITLLFVFCLPVFSDNLRILVTPFSNNSQAEYGWLGYGIEASVIADIAKIAGVEVISLKDRKKAQDELFYQLSGLVDEEKTARVGKTLGANLILGGEYTVIGQDIRLTARLSLVEKGTVVSSVKLDGNINGIFDMQDDIVIRLLSGIDEAKAAPLKAVKLTDKQIQAIKFREGNLNSFEYEARGLEIMESVPQEFLDVEQAVFNLINAERVKAGLKPFIYNVKLAALGRYHSMNMQVYNFFDFTDQNGMSPMGRKLMLAPELFGNVSQLIAWGYGGSLEDVAKRFVAQWMAGETRKELLNPVYNHIGIGIYRGDGDNFRYYCTIVPADLMVELVSSIPKKVAYGSELVLKFKFIGTFPKFDVGIVVRFPDPSARAVKKDGSYYEGYDVFKPAAAQWDGEFFTITIKCDKGRGAYVLQPACGDKFYTFGVTVIAQ